MSKTFTFPHRLHSFSLCEDASGDLWGAAGSFTEGSYKNSATIFAPYAGPDEPVVTSVIPSSYPVSALAWRPGGSCVASAADFVRIHTISSHGAADGRGFALDARSRATEATAPVSSVAWSSGDPNLLAATSVNMTTVIWDTTGPAPRSVVYARKSEYLAVAWARGSRTNILMGSRDGQVLSFDLRSPDGPSTLALALERPVVALSAAPNPYLIGVLPADSQTVPVIDLRRPLTPCLEIALPREAGRASALTWAGDEMIIGTLGGSVLRYASDGTLVGGTQAPAPISALSVAGGVLGIAHGNQASILPLDDRESDNFFTE